MSDQFAILTVCTGNICRSPLAEAVLRQRFVDDSEILVGSAGTQPALGRLMTKQTREIAYYLGTTDARAHRARKVTVDLLREADLVLAMTREHRRKLVELSPSIIRRTFTMREFARLAATTRDSDIVREWALDVDDRAGRLRTAVAAVARGRSRQRRPQFPSDDDVLDPFGGDHAVYTHSAIQLVPAVEGVALLLQRALSLDEEDRWAVNALGMPIS